MCRIIDADKLKDWFFRPYSNEESYSNIEVARRIDEAPTIDQWHYPSKGEYPTENGKYFCNVKSECGDWNNEWYEVIEWTGTDWILNDLERIIAWQYIIPPKEER